MKHFVRNTLKNTGVILVVLLGLFLIAYSILKGSGLTGELAGLFGFEKRIASPAPPLPKPLLPKISGNEVRNYVLFTHVPHNKREVVTGIQYASTQNVKIERQWCYLRDKSSAGGRFTHLGLARITEDGAKSVPSFSSNVLSEFNVTREDVAKLIISHCRFIFKNPNNQTPKKGKSHDKSHERNPVRRHARPDPVGRDPVEQCTYIPGRSKHHCATFEREVLSTSM